LYSLWVQLYLIRVLQSIIEIGETGG
jgi:hypothetical protein